MIRIQVVSRDDENLQTLIRSAIAHGRIKSSHTAKVVGGLKIAHKKHPGTIPISKSHGVVVAAISCTNPSKEWQLLEAFVGRIAYHFRLEVSAINIQLGKA